MTLENINTARLLTRSYALLAKQIPIPYSNVSTAWPGSLQGPSVSVATSFALMGKALLPVLVTHRKHRTQGHSSKGWRMTWQPISRRSGSVKSLMSSQMVQERGLGG